MFIDDNVECKISDTRAENVDDCVAQNALVSREISAPKIDEINESSIIKTEERIDEGKYE